MSARAATRGFLALGAWLNIIGCGVVRASPDTHTTVRETALMEAIRPMLNGKRTRDKDSLIAALVDTVPPQQLRSPDFAFDAATGLAGVGRMDAAYAFLDRAIALGYREDIASFPEAHALQADARWAQVMERQRAMLAEQRAQRRDPRRVAIVTSDITHFWTAYDAAKAVPEDRRVDVFRREYFDRASPGLLTYFYYKMPGEAAFAHTAMAYPRFYESIRDVTLGIERQRDTLAQAMAALSRIYPPAVFPDVYFVIGGLTAGGTSSSVGLLLGADIFSRAPSTVVDELPAALRNVPSDPKGLPAFVVHELMHFQQDLGTDRTLLRGAIEEGGPDFITELAIGRNPNEAIRAYGDRHEAELWHRFAAQMQSTDWSDWIASRDKVTGDVPPDLGYYIGYRICRAYYERAADKSQAIRDILTTHDPVGFLRASGYATRFAER